MLVIIESPFKGDEVENINYARECVRHSLLLGESPIASHLLYTQEGILNDAIESERILGISAGLSWVSVAEKTAVYIDLGISKGMEYGIKVAKDAGVDIEYRKIRGNN